MPSKATEQRMRAVPRVLAGNRHARRVSHTLKVIGKNIRTQMETNNMTKNQAAVAAGIPVSTFENYMRGCSCPGVDNLAKLIAVFDCETNDLIIEKEQKV